MKDICENYLDNVKHFIWDFGLSDWRRNETILKFFSPELNERQLRQLPQLSFTVSLGFRFIFLTFAAVAIWQFYSWPTADHFTRQGESSRQFTR